MKHIYISFVMLLCSTAVWAQAPLRIITSASMFEDMIENLMTDEFTVQSIVPIGGDPHKYKAKPSDARNVQQADLVLVNGLTFEGWITELIENSGTKAKIVRITEGIDVIGSLQYENSSDPHAWMSAANGLIYIENIKNALIELRPSSKEAIEANYETYKAKLVKLDQDIEAAIKKIPVDQRVLITSHDAFQYFGDRYNVRLEAIMGISTEAQAQTSDIIRVTKVIQENKVPAVFIESTINPKMLQQIAKDNKVKIGGELYADSLGDEASSGSTYIDMLWHNTTTIVDALSQKLPLQENTESETRESVPSLTDGLTTTSKIVLASILVLAMLSVLLFKLKKP